MTLSGILTPPSLKAILIGSAALLCFGGGWWTHDKAIYEPHLQKDLKSLIATQAATEHLERASSAVALEVRNSRDAAQAASQTTYKGIQEGVDHYVPSTQATLVCPSATVSPSSVLGGGGTHGVAPPDGPVPSLPLGFVRVLDRAALGEPLLPTTPDGPPGSATGDAGYGAPSGVSLNEAAHGVVANYGTCNADHIDLETWKGWYLKEKALWTKPSVTK